MGFFIYIELAWGTSDDEIHNLSFDKAEELFEKNTWVIFSNPTNLKKDRVTVYGFDEFNKEKALLFKEFLQEKIEQRYIISKAIRAEAESRWLKKLNPL